MLQDVLAVPGYRLSIAPETLRRLWVWTVAARTEISAVGEIEFDGSNIFVTDRIHFLPQKGSFGSTHLDIEELDALMRRFDREGKDTSGMRLWFHTHPRMQAYFSTTDEDAIDMLVTYASPQIAVVFNTSGNLEWCIATPDYQIRRRMTLTGPQPSRAECRLVQPQIQKIVREDIFFKGWRRPWEHDYLDGA